ncbi:MAG: septum formation protein Maf [Aeromicrobium sp.]|nr:septum formation protein Maf [Burkholderiales bacterium]
MFKKSITYLPALHSFPPPLGLNLTSATPAKSLVLASTSRYRAELLNRLQLPYSVIAPNCDEAPLAGEDCASTAIRLAAAKARAGAVGAGAMQAGLASGLIIGSDQVADLEGVALGKPGTRDNAIKQLREMRGKRVVFHTALALLDVASGRLQRVVVPTVVIMRGYSDEAISCYLDRENALDCAGSAKSEGLGAALIATMTSDDPTALVGLPLLSLITMLANEGVEVLT